jgi:hypothetical protein
MAISEGGGLMRGIITIVHTVYSYIYMGNTMYMKRKSLSKYLINTIDFNTHDIEIFIDNT